MSLIFESKPSPERSVARFHMLGQLFGLDTCSPNSSRVLELGCSAGSNLIAHALMFPNSQFLGIDFDSQAIAVAKQRCHELGLRNCTFEEADLTEFDFKSESFDYIICHGLYSWTAPTISSAILEIIGSRLKNNGLAYLSYNTIPGWNTRQKVRELILPLIDRNQSATDQSRQAVEQLNQLLGQKSPSTQFEDMALAEEVNNILSLAPGLIYHELLAEHSRAFPFSEACQNFKENNLQYVFEANLRRNVVDWPNYAAADRLKWQEHHLALEQNSDQRLNRSFRGSLLCRKDDAVSLPDFKKLLSAAYLRCALVPNEAADFFSDQPCTFQTPDAGSIKIHNNFNKALLRQLHQCWPESMSYTDLMQLAQLHLGPLEGADMREANRELENLFWRGQLELTLVPGQGQKLQGSQVEQQVFPLATIEARDRNWITNTALEYVALDPFEQAYLLEHGKVSRQKIADFINKKIKSGDLHLSLDGQISGEAIPAETLNFLAEQILQRFSEAGLIFNR
jgi:ubiquinone/menaquinone biosynthesis C-methylase UbiE/methyltransferase-like protein